MINIRDILIIDDSLDEAYRLQKLFLEEGCTTIISKPEDITEKFEFFPKIICCDLNLYGNNDDLNFKTIRGLLKKIYKDKYPYIFIAWTSHKQKLRKLSASIKQDTSIVKPLSFKSFDKVDFERNGVRKLKAHLKDIFANNLGIYILLAWEYHINKASENSMTNVSKITEISHCSIEEAVALLAEKTYGQNIKSNEVKAINTPLHLILKDSLDEQKFSTSEKNCFIKILSTPTKRIDPAIKPALNSVLHISKKESKEKISPGDFIQLTGNKLKNILHKKIKKKGTAKDIKKNIIEDIFDKNKYPTDISNIIFGMVNITADCDASNNKQGFNKFVLSYLVPLSIPLKSTLSDAHKNTKIDVSFNGKNYALILDSRYIFGTGEDHLLAKKKIFRIRESLFLKLKQGVFNHNQRIGTISF